MTGYGDDEVLPVISEWKGQQRPTAGPQRALLAWEVLGMLEEKRLNEPMLGKGVNDLQLRARVCSRSGAPAATTGWSPAPRR